MRTNRAWVRWWKRPESMGPGSKDEAFEMEKIRDQRIEERRVRELQLHEEFLQDASTRGGSQQRQSSGYRALGTQDMDEMMM